MDMVPDRRQWRILPAMARPSTPTASVPRQVLTHLLLVVMSVVALYPVLWVLKMALTPGQAFSMDPSPIPESVTMQNFVDVVATTAADGSWLFGRQLFNSLVVSVATASVGIGLSCTAAYSMSRFAFPGRDAGMNLFLVTQMFPGVVMAIPLYILLDEAGLLDSLVGLALVYSTTAVPSWPRRSSARRRRSRCRSCCGAMSATSVPSGAGSRRGPSSSACP